MVGLPDPELIGGRADALQREGFATLALDGQRKVGDRAVEAVVLGADRIRVDPAHDVARLRRDAAANPDLLPGELEPALLGLLVDARRADPVEPAEPVALAVDRQHGVADP